MGLCLRFTLHLVRQSAPPGLAGVSTGRAGPGLGFRDLERIRFGESGTRREAGWGLSGGFEEMGFIYLLNQKASNFIIPKLDFKFECILYFLNCIRDHGLSMITSLRPKTLTHNKIQYW